MRAHNECTIGKMTAPYERLHRQMPEMVNAVKRGVLEAGGLPLAFPTISLHEINTSPTTMLYRNLEAMETEEMIKAQPMDSVVLLGGCDKTVPAQAMAAISADIPAIMEVAGPMMTGYYKGEPFWGSYNERSEIVSEWISEMKSLGMKLVMPPADWYNINPEKYAKEYMEANSSVHLSPAKYRRKDWGKSALGIFE